MAWLGIAASLGSAVAARQGGEAGADSAAESGTKSLATQAGPDFDAVMKTVTALHERVTSFTTSADGLRILYEAKLGTARAEGVRSIGIGTVWAPLWHHVAMSSGSKLLRDEVNVQFTLVGLASYYSTLLTEGLIDSATVLAHHGLAALGAKVSPLVSLRAGQAILHDTLGTNLAQVWQRIYPERGLLRGGLATHAHFLSTFGLNVGLVKLAEMSGVLQPMSEFSGELFASGLGWMDGWIDWRAVGQAMPGLGLFLSPQIVDHVLYPTTQPIKSFLAPPAGVPMAPAAIALNALIATIGAATLLDMGAQGGYYFLGDEGTAARLTGAGVGASYYGDERPASERYATINPLTILAQGMRDLNLGKTYADWVVSGHAGPLSWLRDRADSGYVWAHDTVLDVFGRGEWSQRAANFVGMDVRMTAAMLREFTAEKRAILARAVDETLTREFTQCILLGAEGYRKLQAGTLTDDDKLTIMLERAQLGGLEKIYVPAECLLYLPALDAQERNVYHAMRQVDALRNPDDDNGYGDPLRDWQGILSETIRESTMDGKGANGKPLIANETVVRDETALIEKLGGRQKLLDLQQQLFAAVHLRARLHAERARVRLAAFTPADAPADQAAALVGWITAFAQYQSLAVTAQKNGWVLHESGKTQLRDADYRAWREIANRTVESGTTAEREELRTDALRLSDALASAEISLPEKQEGLAQLLLLGPERLFGTDSPEASRILELMRTVAAAAGLPTAAHRAIREQAEYFVGTAQAALAQDVEAQWSFDAITPPDNGAYEETYLALAGQAEFDGAVATRQLLEGLARAADTNPVIRSEYEKSGYPLDDDVSAARASVDAWKTRADGVAPLRCDGESLAHRARHLIDTSTGSRVEATRVQELSTALTTLQGLTGTEPYPGGTAQWEHDLAALHRGLAEDVNTPSYQRLTAGDLAHIEYRLRQMARERPALPWQIMGHECRERTRLLRRPTLTDVPALYRHAAALHAVAGEIVTLPTGLLADGHFATATDLRTHIAPTVAQRRATARDALTVTTPLTPWFGQRFMTGQALPESYLHAKRGEMLAVQAHIESRLATAWIRAEVVEGITDPSHAERWVANHLEHSREAGALARDIQQYLLLHEQTRNQVRDLRLGSHLFQADGRIVDVGWTRSPLAPAALATAATALLVEIETTLTDPTVSDTDRARRTDQAQRLAALIGQVPYTASLLGSRPVANLFTRLETELTTLPLAPEVRATKEAQIERLRQYWHGLPFEEHQAITASATIQHLWTQSATSLQREEAPHREWLQQLHQAYRLARHLGEPSLVTQLLQQPTIQTRLRAMDIATRVQWADVTYAVLHDLHRAWTPSKESIAPESYGVAARLAGDRQRLHQPQPGQPDIGLLDPLARVQEHQAAARREYDATMQNLSDLMRSTMGDVTVPIEHPLVSGGSKYWRHTTSPATTPIPLAAPSACGTRRRPDLDR